MNTISHLKKWAIVIIGITTWSISTAQNSTFDRFIEIPHYKPDNNHTPQNTERKRIPLGVPSVRQTAEGQKAVLQKFNEPTRLHPVNETLTLQGCEGKPMSKEEAMHNGNVCAR